MSLGGDNRKKAAGYEWIYEHGCGEGEIVSGDLFGSYLDSPLSSLHPGLLANAVRSGATNRAR